MNYIGKHRVRSAAVGDAFAPAAAIWIRPGVIAYPRGRLARALAGTAVDLTRAAALRRAGDKAAARDRLALARDARRLLGAPRLP